MCGIFGFVAKKPHETAEILRGLSALEYRGYDSWGISVKDQNNIKVEKFTGKLADTKLKSLLSNGVSQLSIGHTRWATHGGVTVANAHPHLDCTKKISLVHNGIFENYEEVRNILKKHKHKFSSQTDTEVIVHLAEEYYKTNTFTQAVHKTFNSIHGLNAIVIMNVIENQIVAIKNGSPLLVGITSDALYIASDISALPIEVNKFVVLKDNQMAILGEKLDIISLETGNNIKYKTENFKYDASEVSKGKYPHFMLKEIYEQPTILAGLFSSEAENINRLSRKVKSAFGTYLLGCGTASYAAFAGEYFFSKIAKKHVNFSVGSEFKYVQDFIVKKSLIIPISQSGETIDVVEPVQNAIKKGAFVSAIVNVPTSTLSRIANTSILLHAGVERAVVGTKSFTSMLGVLLLLAYSFVNKISEADRLLKIASNDARKILSSSSVTKIKQLASRLKKADHAFLIGRGISYVAALEGALKLKETSLVHAEGFAGGELKHGVIALIEKNTPCFVMAPKDETYLEIISNAQEIKSRGGFIIGIGPINNSVFDVFLKTADIGPATIISQTIYMQMLAYYLALERGIKDPDKPRNLAKSVTVK